MHFRILKMTATSGFLTALECAKFVFGQCSTPDPAREAYSAPSDTVQTVLLRGEGAPS